MILHHFRKNKRHKPLNRVACWFYIIITHRLPAAVGERSLGSSRLRNSSFPYKTNWKVTGRLKMIILMPNQFRLDRTNLLVSFATQKARSRRKHDPRVWNARASHAPARVPKKITTVSQSTAPSPRSILEKELRPDSRKRRNRAYYMSRWNDEILGKCASRTRLQEFVTLSFSVSQGGLCPVFTQFAKLVNN